MLRFLHLSDLHVRSSPANNTELLKRLSFVRKNYPLHKKIITGDVTDDGSWLQYTNAKKYLMFNAYVCPGNHDYGYAGNFYGKKRARRFDRYITQTTAYMRLARKPVVDVVTEGETTVVLIGLDSNIRTRHIFDFACGKIGYVQRCWLKRVLRKARRRYPGCVRIVYFHHHPFDRGFGTELKDAKKLMKIINNNCELVLFGHKHKAQLWKYGALAAAGKLSECDVVTEIVVDRESIAFNEVKVKE